MTDLMSALKNSEKIEEGFGQTVKNGINAVKQGQGISGAVDAFKQTTASDAKAKTDANQKAAADKANAKEKNNNTVAIQNMGKALNIDWTKINGTYIAATQANANPQMIEQFKKYVADADKASGTQMYSKQFAKFLGANQPKEQPAQQAPQQTTQQAADAPLDVSDPAELGVQIKNLIEKNKAGAQ